MVLIVIFDFSVILTPLWETGGEIRLDVRQHDACDVVSSSTSWAGILVAVDFKTVLRNIKLYS